MSAPSTEPWMPAKSRAIRARFEGKCLWCGSIIPADSSAVYYPEEKEIAHAVCHTEACK